MQHPKRVKAHNRIVVFVAILLFGILSAPAATIVDVSGTATDAGQIIDPDQAGGVSFTLSAAYTNVEISANILCIDCVGILYLTTAVGPTATTADIVDIINPFNTVTGSPYFSNLSLGAGTYFVILQIEQNPSLGNPASSRAIWGGSSSATVLTDGAATKNLDLEADPAAALGFQSNFGIRPEYDLFFTVTGTPEGNGGDGSPVPEPSSLSLLVFGLISAGIFRSRFAR